MSEEGRRRDRGERGERRRRDDNSSEVKEEVKEVKEETPKRKRERDGPTEFTDDAVKDENIMWVPDEKEAFVLAEVLDRVGETIKLKKQNNGEEVEFKLKDMHNVNPSPKYDKIDDMATFAYLNEPSVLNNIWQRYQEDNIYTYSGLFLVAVNPYHQLPIYSKEYVEKYKGKQRGDLPPHVYAVAEEAYRGMLQNGNQSMLVTGESGAGKTENAKKIINYLTGVAGSQTSKDLDQKILQTNPLLEAFGNAKTVKNDNSSRFGKFIEINFNSKNVICGASVQNYLLELVRVVDRADSERNFHIFYQIFTNDEIRKKYSLSSVDQYTYLRYKDKENKNKPYQVYNKDGKLTVDDVAEFKATLKCMETIGFSKDEIDFCLSTIAGILHLSNITFTADSNGVAEITDKEAIKTAATLFKIKVKDLEESLIHPTYKVGGEEHRTDKTPEEAAFNRNALSKSIYNRLFNYIVAKVNISLTSTETIKNFIGVLDIAGFEIFDDKDGGNSFEQLCINFTNEKLQQFYNTIMFKKEQEEYLREQIDWKEIDFGLDLQATIDLIEKPLGLFSLLEGQNSMGAKDESNLIELFMKSQDNFKDSKGQKLKKDRFAKNKFIITHYAGEVPYKIDNWLTKNIDPLNDDLKDVLYASKNDLMSKLFQQDIKDRGDSQKKTRGTKFMTVSQTYKEQLSSLMNVLYNTDPHFIRCIIPNHDKCGGYLYNPLIIDQLRCNGVIEGIRITRKGYPGRLFFQAFVQRYGCLCDAKTLNSGQTVRIKSELILQAVKLQETKQYKIGTKKVFLKASVEAYLEKVRDERVAEIILAVQAAARGYLAKKNYDQLLSKIGAIEMIQNNVRSYMQLKNWAWWGLFTKARVLIDGSSGEKEKKKTEEALQQYKTDLEKEKDNVKKLLSEKDQLNNQIEKLKADLDNNQKKNEGIKSDISVFQNRQTELETSLDSILRERRQLDQEKTNIFEELQKVQNEVREKQQEIDDLHKTLGDSSSGSKELTDKIKEISEQKLKLESKGKSLDEEFKEKKQKYDNEIQRGIDLERVKSGLEDGIKDLNYKLQSLSKDKSTLEQKGIELESKLKDLEKDLKKSQDTHSELNSQITLKESQNEMLQSELSENKNKLEDYSKEKRSLEGKQREFNEKLDESEQKRVQMEKQLRVAKEDFTEFKNKKEKLEEDNTLLSETVRSGKEEIGTLKSKLNETEEERNMLNKKRSDIEKLISDLKFDANEEDERNKKDVETQTKRLEDTERELKEQINQLKQSELQAENKYKQKKGELKTLQKSMTSLQTEKEQLDSNYQKLQSSLSDEQNELVNQKKLSSDFENKNRILSNKEKEFENKIKSENEELQRIEGKRKQLQQQLNSVQEQLKTCEKERDELERECKELNKQFLETKDKLDQSSSELSELKTRTGIQASELNSTKTTLEDENSENNRLKNKTKDLESKSTQLSSSIDTENIEKETLLKKVKKLELELERLKKLEKDQKDQISLLQQGNQTSESELKEKKKILDEENSKIEDLNRKLKQAKQTLDDLESSGSSKGSQLNKLKDENLQLESQVHSLTERVEDAEKKLNGTENNFKGLNDKLSQMLRDHGVEVQNSNKFKNENHKLKQEIDVARENLEQSEKKTRKLVDDAKSKLDRTETEQEMNLKKSTDERNQLKKKNKDLLKGADLNSETGTINKEALTRAQLEYENQINELKLLIDEERKQKMSAETTKKQLDYQLKEVKDLLESEEREKKKLSISKKSLQLEMEELKELAEEAEEISEELERFKEENELYKKDLQSEITKEKNLRSQHDNEANKLRKEVDDLRKQLSDFKQQEADSIKKLRSKYESEIDEMDLVIEKAKKDKGSNLKSEKKLERDSRDIQRKVDNLEKEVQSITEKSNSSQKELSKTNDEMKKSSRKLNELDSTNKILIKDLDLFKNKAKDLEDELLNLKEQYEREKKKNKGGKKVQDDDDDDDLSE
jgi:myosin heavy chain 9/10/11/14